MSGNKKDSSGIIPSSGNLEDNLLSKYPKIFEGLSNDKRKEVIGFLKEFLSVEIKREIIKSSPIPFPEDLKGYYEIDKKYADTIIKMSQDDQKHYHSRDIIIIEKSFSVKARGQSYALMIAIVAIIGGVTCILFGYEISGTLLGGVGLASLISEFLEKSFLERFWKRNALQNNP